MKFIMIFVFVIFVIGLNYVMQKKMAKMGGVPPGTLPEEMEDMHVKESIICSECGAEIDSDATSCPKCGEVFEGEEFQCPKCEKIIPEEAGKCPHCGNKFIAFEEEPRKVSKTKTKDKAIKRTEDKIYCSECGAIVDEDMDVCPGCGELFEEDIFDVEPKGKTQESEPEEDLTFICSVCGASVPESAKRCPKCKTEFE